MIGIKLPDEVIKENGHFKTKTGKWSVLKNGDGWMMYVQDHKAKSKLLTTSLKLGELLESLSDEEKGKLDYKDTSLKTAMLMMAHLGKGQLECPRKFEHNLPSYLVFQMHDNVHMLSYCPDDAQAKARMTFSSLQMHIVPLLSLPEKKSAKCHLTEFEEMTDTERMKAVFKEHFKKVPKEWHCQ